MANKFKVGDRVEIINNGKEYTTYKKWFENNRLKIVNEYENGKGHKNGLKGIIKYIEKHSSHCDDILCAVKIDVGDVVLIGQNGLKLISHPSIHIYPNKTNTNETIAVLKQGKEIIKTTKAMRNPDDQYDFEKGANVAVNRLLGADEPKLVTNWGNWGSREVKEVKRKAEAGEWVKIVNPTIKPKTNGTLDYEYGSVIKILRNEGEDVGIYAYGFDDESRIRCVFPREYVVLENYKPAKSIKPDLSTISDVELLDEIAKRMRGAK